jgi:hypothetical protein
MRYGIGDKRQDEGLIYTFGCTCCKIAPSQSAAFLLLPKYAKKKLRGKRFLFSQATATKCQWRIRYIR